MAQIEHDGRSFESDIVEVISRSRFQNCMANDIRKFRADMIEKYEDAPGASGGYLALLQPDGKSTKHVLIHTQRELEVPWGIRKSPKSDMWGFAVKLDDELKAFCNFLDDRIIDQLASRSETVFGKKMIHEKVADNYTGMVRGEFLFLGVPVSGMKYGPRKMIDDDALGPFMMLGVNGEPVDFEKLGAEEDGVHAVVVFQPFIWIGEGSTCGCKAFASELRVTRRHSDLKGTSCLEMDLAFDDGKKQRPGELTKSAAGVGKFAQTQ